MARVIEMPKLSDTMEEGGIAKWLKKEGDTVKEGEPLLEIETDKATQEYESPEKGTLLKIVAPNGTTVSLRAPIAIFGDKGEKFDLDALLGAAHQGKGAPSWEAKKEEPKAPSKAKDNVVDLPQAKAVAITPKQGAGSPSPSSGDGRVKASPLAKKVAAEQGVDVTSVAGSGPSGRVVMRDVAAAAASAGGKGSDRTPGLKPYQPSARASLGLEDQIIPVSMMRKTIAKRLLAGKNDAPHFYLTVSADMAKMLAWRQRLNDEAAAAAKAGQDLPKVSVNDLVILAAARALRRHPVVNSSWQGDTILQNGHVHVAVAVALPEGLVTPVVRDADSIGVRDIAHNVRILAAKAKASKLANEDYAGGTFTISNLGMFGIEDFTAIINPPQAAILAVGATQAVPWVDAKGAIVAQQRMKMTLSCDHRVVDGATGAQFLQTLVGFLEDPLLMMS